MSAKPESEYRDDSPGKHLPFYAGRDCIGFLVERSGEVHVYNSDGSFLATVVDQREAKDLLLQTFALRNGRRCS